MKFDIAVVGMGCVFPGANTPEEFFEVVRSGETQTGPFPSQLWDFDHFNEDSADKSPSPRKSISRIGAFVPELPINSEELGLNSSTIEGFDRAVIASLEVCRQALKDSNIGMEESRKASIFIGTSGTEAFKHATIALRRHVFVDSISDDLRARGFSDKDLELLSSQLGESLAAKGHSWTKDTNLASSSCSAIFAGLNRAFGFSGTQMAIDAACASSFAALDTACAALRSYDASSAIVLGVDMQISPLAFVGFSRIDGLSRKGVSSPFDATADGIVIGEGAGAVVLKRLEDAIEAKDNIRAVIKGVGSSSDGAGKAIYAPSVKGRISALRDGLQRAELSGKKVQYLEAHATSTAAGDSSEYEAIAKVYGKDRSSGNTLVLGSVKHQIGHLKAAAGIAGLIKTILCMKEGLFPHMPRFKSLTPHIAHPCEALEIPTSTSTWAPNGDGHRTAAVTACGFGGINYHVVLESTDSYSATASPIQNIKPVAIVACEYEIPEVENQSDIDNALQDEIPTPPHLYEPKGWGTLRRASGPGANFSLKGVTRIDAPETNYLRYTLFPNSASQLSPSQPLALSLADDLLMKRGYELKQEKPMATVLGFMHDEYLANAWAPLCIDEYWDALEQIPKYSEIANDPLIRTNGTERFLAYHPPTTQHTMPGHMANLVSGRISNKLNLTGPNFIVDASYASSLAALQASIYQVFLGRATGGVLWGGVNRQHSDVFAALLDSQAGLFPETPKPNHPPIGDGAAMFLLKDLEAAEQDGDEILAVVNHVSGSARTSAKDLVSFFELIRDTLTNASDLPTPQNVYWDFPECVHEGAIRDVETSNPNAANRVVSNHYLQTSNRFGHSMGAAGAIATVAMIRALSMNAPDSGDAGVIVSAGLGGELFAAHLSGPRPSTRNNNKDNTSKDEKISKLATSLRKDEGFWTQIAETEPGLRESLIKAGLID